MCVLGGLGWKEVGGGGEKKVESEKKSQETQQSFTNIKVQNNGVEGNAAGFTLAGSPDSY